MPRSDGSLNAVGGAPYQRTCRWIETDPQVNPAVCGAPVEGKGSWCGAHAARVFQPRLVRRPKANPGDNRLVEARRAVGRIYEYGPWPATRRVTPLPPSPETLSWLRSRQIAYARAQEKARENAAVESVEVASC